MNREEWDVSEEAWKAMQIPEEEYPANFDKWKEEEKDKWKLARMDAVMATIPPHLMDEINAAVERKLKILKAARTAKFLNDIINEIKLGHRAAVSYFDEIDKRDRAEKRRRAREAAKE